MLPREVLDLCFTLLDAAAIMPYYFYLCDVIPGGEHWRLSPVAAGAAGLAAAAL